MMALWSAQPAAGQGQGDRRPSDSDAVVANAIDDLKDELQRASQVSPELRRMREQQRSF